MTTEKTKAPIHRELLPEWKERIASLLKSRDISIGAMMPDSFIANTEKGKEFLREFYGEPSPRPISGLTIGRDCHYYHEGIPNAFAAKIAFIHDPVIGDCTLTLFDHDGRTRATRCLYAEVRTAGHWSWMARVP